MGGCLTFVTHEVFCIRCARTWTAASTTSAGFYAIAIRHASFYIVNACCLSFHPIGPIGALRM